MSRPTIGQPVTLSVPGSPLDGITATVDRLEEWGAHVRTGVGSGVYRASWDEMGPVTVGPSPSANGVHKPVQEVRDSGFDQDAYQAGYTGDVCGKCGGSRLRRTGACTTCEDCFESGCS